MEKFDVLVIGAGSGMIVAANAVANGLKTALVESGPIGGTCVNRGCVPSKMLIYPADVASVIYGAEKLGIKATIENIDFDRITKRMNKLVAEDVGRQTRAVEEDTRIRWFKGKGEFVSDYTLKTGEDVVKADKIFIVSGTRPNVPPLKGIENVSFLTSDTVLSLDALPRSMVIIGGGYVAAEYGHFFSSLGTKVTILQRNSRILPDEEPEISQLLAEEMAKRIEVFTNYEAVEVMERESTKIVVARSRVSGQVKEFSGDAILIAAGRIPNSDVLKPERTGVELDKMGFVRVNEFLETSKKNIFAFGDAIGKQMFKHVANYEAQVAWHNSGRDHKVKVDYSAAPHAVFTYPQVASVGMKEAEALQSGFKILVGRAFYRDTAQGAAMAETGSFVKVIVEKETGRILGAHIIGPFASMLIQEIINAMASGDGTFVPIFRGLHIHPSMTEVVQNAFSTLKQP